MQLRPILKVLLAVFLVLATASVAATVMSDSDGASGTLYTVTLNGNGGTTSDNRTTEIHSVISGQSFITPSSTFSKDGYILVGWADTNSASSPRYHPGQGVTVTGNTTLYAVWEDLTYKDLTRMSGSSSSSTAEADVVEGKVGVSPTLPLGDDSAYIIMQEVAGLGRTMKYTLTVSHCGTPISSEATTRNTSVSADWLTLKISSAGKFTFSGSPGSEGIYTITLTLKTRSTGGDYGGMDDLMLKWYVVVPVSADSSLTLTFDLDGGSGSLNAVSGIHGSATVLPDVNDSTGNTIRKSGYTLVGWEIPDGRGSTSVYALGSLYTLAFDAVATAKWIADPDVLVYSLDGGSLDNVQAYVVADGTPQTLRDSGVSKPGYTFVGWKLTKDRQFAYAPGMDVMVTGSMYMEAYFVKDGDQLYTITYDFNGGYGTVPSQQVESGMFVMMPTSLSMVRDGYTFIGWSEERDGTLYSETHYQVESDVTMYAVWEENGSGGTDPDPDDPDPRPTYYTVSFSVNQGQGDYPVQRVKSGGYVSKPADPTRDGHIFTGWRALGKTDNWDFRKDTVTSDTILQAQWEEHFRISVVETTVTVTICGTYYDMAFDIDWDDINGAFSQTFGPSCGPVSHKYKDEKDEGITSYGYITVRSKDSSGEYESRMPYSVQGKHWNPPLNYIVTYDPGNGGLFHQEIVPVGGKAPRIDDPVWEGHTFTGWYFEGSLWDFSRTVTMEMTLTGGWDNVTPDTPTAIHPKASFTLTATADGWTADASGSENAVSFAWYLDNTYMGDGRTVTVKSDGLKDGTHSLRLVVRSTTGHTDTVSETFNVGSDPEPTPTPDPEEGGRSWFRENRVYIALFVVLVIILVVRFWI